MRGPATAPRGRPVVGWAIWITGPPGSGTSAVVHGAARGLEARDLHVAVLELGTLQQALAPAGRGTVEERQRVHRALVHVASLLVDVGVPVVIDATADHREWRELARSLIARFAEVRLVCGLDGGGAREPARILDQVPGGADDAAGRPVVGPSRRAGPPELTVDTRVTPLDATIGRVVDLAQALERATPARRASPPRAWAMWLTGVPGSGKSTLAQRVVDALAHEGRPAQRLGVEPLRQFVLGSARPAPGDEELLHRALVVAACALTDAGVRVVIDAVGARRRWRDLARRHLPRFAEAQLIAPLGLCCERERAVRWNLTPCGHTRPSPAATEGPDVVFDYEHSLSPDLMLRTDTIDVQGATRELLRLAGRLERSAEHPVAGPEEITMRVRDLMTRGLITVSPETTVTEARTLMANERIRHLLVTDAGRLAGIVTDRDIRLNLASPATTLSVWELNYLLARLTVREVMTKSLIVVDPDRSAREAARIMLDHKIGALPVLDGDQLLGILTETDLVRAFAETPEPATAIR
jgi:CBS domain-containing protein/adenylylsulfate kinase-like enzyme